MSWARFDDKADGDKLMLALADVGDAAVAMWFRAILHCSRNLTDGFVGEKFIKGLVSHKNPKRVAKALVDAKVLPEENGLFIEVEGGFLVNDYLQFNPSREQVLAERDKARTRMIGKRSPGVRPNTTRTEDEPDQNTTGTQPEQQANDTGCSSEPLAGARGRPPAAASRPVPSPTDPSTTPSRARVGEGPPDKPEDPGPESPGLEQVREALREHPTTRAAKLADDVRFVAALHGAAAMPGKLAHLPRAIQQAVAKCQGDEDDPRFREILLRFAGTVMPERLPPPRSHAPVAQGGTKTPIPKQRATATETEDIDP